MAQNLVHLLDRVELEGAFGTVRWKGNLPQWGPATLAYGIEWDDAQRGKNSGNVGDVVYFSVRVPQSGSFVKSSNKKLRVGRSFVDVLTEEYSGDGNVEALKQAILFGLKKAESLGFEELNERSRQLDHLESVTLDRKAILHCGDLAQISLASVKHLDLSYNLFVNMEEVSRIVEKMPLLETLNVNGNVFSKFGRAKIPAECVFAADCGLNEVDLDDFLGVFPKLRKLCVASNKLTNVPGSQLSHLDLLDLSFNSLKEVPSVPVRELILANNHIEHLHTILPAKVLDLRENKISSWPEIEKISQLFPDLEDLRIDGCSLFENMSVDEMTTQLIGRLQCLTTGPGIRKLNGSTLLDDEIRSAELYVVSLIQKGESVLKTRLEQLQEKYRFQKEERIEALPQKNRLVISVNGPSGSLFSRVFLPSNSVLRLKGIITKHTGVPVHRFSLYYYPNSALRVSKTYLDDDVASLASAGLENQQHVFFEPLPL